MNAPTPGLRPEWFDWAVSRQRESRFVEASGTRIHYASWNAHETVKPALLLAHGFLGHTHWWDFVAPFLADRFRVFALDFSGMGLSAPRADYAPGCFVDDLRAVTEAIRADERPVTLVGHSFGGTRALQFCVEYPRQAARAVVLDSYVMFAGDERPVVNYRQQQPPAASAEELLARFRLLPPQDCLPCALDHVARHSVCRRKGGWRWCFDPALRASNPPVVDIAALPGLRVQVDYVHAEASSVVSASRALRIAGALPLGRGPVTMPCAGHHMMLDQPLALVGVLRALLAPSRGMAGA